MSDERPMQRTPQGLEIPIPTRREFFDALDRVTGAKHYKPKDEDPAETGPPRKSQQDSTDQPIG